MVSGSKEVSASYTISNKGRITCAVDEDRRAWTSGSSSDGGSGRAWDMRAVTVENENGDPDWRISGAPLNAAAALLNDLRSRYNIAHVLGHRDLRNSYSASCPTFCPGPNTVATIVARANGGASAPAGAAVAASVPASSSGWIYWEPNGTGLARRVQKALKARGRYDGNCDDPFGPLSRKGCR